MSDEKRVEMSCAPQPKPAPEAAAQPMEKMKSACYEIQVYRCVTSCKLQVSQVTSCRCCQATSYTLPSYKLRAEELQKRLGRFASEAHAAQALAQRKESKHGQRGRAAADALHHLARARERHAARDERIARRAGGERAHAARDEREQRRSRPLEERGLHGDHAAREVLETTLGVDAGLALSLFRYTVE